MQSAQQYPNVAFQSVVTKISQGKKISRFDQSFELSLFPTLFNAKMLCLVILQRVQMGITIRKSKTSTRLTRSISHMKLKKLQRLKQKSKPITTTLESAIILQYSFKNEVEETVVSKTNPMFNLLSTMTCSWF